MPPARPSSARHAAPACRRSVAQRGEVGYGQDAGAGLGDQFPEHELGIIGPGEAPDIGAAHRAPGRRRRPWHEGGAARMPMWSRCRAAGLEASGTPEDPAKQRRGRPIGGQLERVDQREERVASHAMTRSPSAGWPSPLARRSDSDPMPLARARRRGWRAAAARARSSSRFTTGVAVRSSARRADEPWCDRRVASRERVPEVMALVDDHHAVAGRQRSAARPRVGHDLDGHARVTWRCDASARGVSPARARW